LVKISVEWLSELLPVELPAEQIAARLTGVGFEVEGREERTLPGGEGGIVAALVRTRKPIEGSDHLSVCEVDDGAQRFQVVCGAQNYQAGDVVPLARVGAALPGGQTITRAKLRGVESAGMLCSARELGLSDDHSGLLILPRDTKLGTPLAALLGLPDTVLDVNVAPNRPDALSHLGIARELAALTGARLKVTGAPAPEAPAAPRGKAPKAAAGAGSAGAAARVDVEDAAGCPRYVARVIEGVRIGPSPLHLQERLRSCGVRPISNVVDATNLALLELGHPLHAFDLDKLAGGRIVVRRARAGEPMVTLDGKERALSEDDLVIADGERPVAIAGVMGGATSEVHAGTTRILLESAVFDPARVRRTARRHALHTEASHRFERGADERMAQQAADRCAELIVQLAGGRILPGSIDRWPAPKPLRRIWVRPARVRAVLGASVPDAEVETRLRSLGLVPLEEAGSSAEHRLWEVPSFRLDLTREIDCVEEVARQRGLDSIPIVLHPAGIGETAAESPAAVAVRRAREALAARGYDEVVNYSFLAEKDLLALAPRTAGVEPVRPLRVANPLTVEQGALRTSLVAGLLRTLQRNLAHGASDVRLYELARVYLPQHDAAHPEGPLAWPVAEPTRLGLLAHGRAQPRFWAKQDESQVSFFDLKGLIEDLTSSLRLQDVSFAPAPASAAPYLHPASAGLLRAGGEALGVFGELHPLVAAHFEVPQGVLVGELSWEGLAARARLVAQMGGVPRFPAVPRDLAFVVDAAVPAARALAEIRAADDKGLLESVELFDQYRGHQVPAGKKSLAFSLTLRAPDRTLTDPEADALCAAAAARLKASLGAELRT
jgi:phenylalanyl-tRNA synthetase beta chain